MIKAAWWRTLKSATTGQFLQLLTFRGQTFLHRTPLLRHSQIVQKQLVWVVALAFSFQPTELINRCQTRYHFPFGNVWVILNPDFPIFDMLEILAIWGLHQGDEAKSLMKCVWYFWHTLDFRIQRTCQLVRMNRKRNTLKKGTHLLNPWKEEEICRDGCHLSNID